MKTPRELLLARHRPAETRLDSIREQAIATLKESQDEAPSCFERWADGARALLSLPRFACGGLAVAWLVIIALNLAVWESARQQTLTVAKSQFPSETLQAVREQKRLLAELTGLAEPAHEAPPFVPRPRSERRYERIMV
jgi:hypothetical protein